MRAVDYRKKVCQASARNSSVGSAVKLKYIPNIICVVRIILVAPIVWSLLQERYGLALSLSSGGGAFRRAGWLLGEEVRLADSARAACSTLQRTSC